MGLRRQALSGVKWTGGATLITATLQFLQIVVLARLLLPEDFGLMALVTIVIGFVQTYTDMGISGAIVQRQDATVQQLSSLFWLNILVGLGVFGVLHRFEFIDPVDADEHRGPSGGRFDHGL